MDIVFLLKVMKPSHSYKQDGSVKSSSHMFIFQKLIASISSVPYFGQNDVLFLRSKEVFRKNVKQL